MGSRAAKKGSTTERANTRVHSVYVMTAAAAGEREIIIGTFSGYGVCTIYTWSSLRDDFARKSAAVCR